MSAVEQSAHDGLPAISPQSLEQLPVELVSQQRDDPLGVRVAQHGRAQTEPEGLGPVGAVHGGEQLPGGETGQLRPQPERRHGHGPVQAPGGSALVGGRRGARGVTQELGVVVLGRYDDHASADQLALDPEDLCGPRLRSAGVSAVRQPGEQVHSRSAHLGAAVVQSPLEQRLVGDRQALAQ